MTTIPDSNIVLRLPRPQKGRYVAAARAQGLTLAAWIFARLDECSAPFPPSSEPDPAPVPPAASNRPWTPAEDALLGTLPDGRLARQIGRSRAGVIARRIRQGIAPHRPPGRPGGPSTSGSIR